MQSGGLSFATVVTLLLVPILYSIFVLDLKLIRWGEAYGEADAPRTPAPIPNLLNAPAPAE